MKYFYIFLLISTPLLFNSCKKPISGCTDTLASNYNATAEKDKGDCIYSADLLFWYNSSGAPVAYTSVDVRFLIDGVSIGSSSASLGHSSEPSCETADVVKFNFDMLKNKAGIYSLEVRASTNNALLYTETLNIISSSCNKIKLN
jgi:hypothetical protein